MAVQQRTDMYFLGESLDREFTFKDSNGNEQDADTLTVRFTYADGTHDEVVWTSGSPPTTITKTAIGVYLVQVPCGTVSTDEGICEVKITYERGVSQREVRFTINIEL